MNYSIVIPAYNEGANITAVLQKLVSFIKEKSLDVKVIVVNDGSKDNTAEAVKKVPEVTLISHPVNKGYGAALKTGVRHSQTEWVLTYDADGQHTPEFMLQIINIINDQTDLVIGERQGYQGPWIRQPGKKLIRLVANYLTEAKVVDYNSGLRAFRRTLFLQYAHLFPSGFSLSTTSTVCFLKQGHSVVFTPITIQKREGKSTVKPRDAVKTMMLIVRLTMLFSPLRVFFPVALLMGLLGIGWLAYDLIVHTNVSDSSVFILLFASILFFFGLLSDQVAALRREQNINNQL